jgi:hypothetical protein
MSAHLPCAESTGWRNLLERESAAKTAALLDRLKPTKAARVSLTTTEHGRPWTTCTTTL